MAFVLAILIATPPAALCAMHHACKSSHACCTRSAPRTAAAKAEAAITVPALVPQCVEVVPAAERGVHVAELDTPLSPYFAPLQTIQLRI